MKYFIYSFIWKRPGGQFNSSGTSLFAGESVVDLYEFNIKQPEEWVITHCQEITKEEYDRADENGIIG